MATDSSSTMLLRRDDDNDVVYIDQYGNVYDSFWYTRTGVIVKWVLFFAFVTLVTLYFFVGRNLARRRVRNNKKPFFGTAWLLSRRERGLVDPRFAANTWPGHGQNGGYYQQPGAGGYYNHQQQYPMGNMYAGPPPPVYDANRPPVYEQNGAPDAGVNASKIDPNQQSAGVGPAAAAGAPGAGGSDFAPPPGPPPPRS